MVMIQQSGTITGQITPAGSVTGEMVFPSVTQERLYAAIEKYFEEHPVEGGGTVSDERIAYAVNNYLEENPVQVESPAKISYVTLLAAAWHGEGDLYSQIVTMDGITANSQVDLTPNAEQLVAFRSKDLTFVTKNANGVVTVYAIGQKPQNDYTIQVTITEVVR